MTFQKWKDSLSFDRRCFQAITAEDGWDARSAIAYAREAELRGEIAAKDAEIERLTKENEALRRDAANARRFIQMTAKQ